MFWLECLIEDITIDDKTGTLAATSWVVEPIALDMPSAGEILRSPRDRGAPAAVKKRKGQELPAEEVSTGGRMEPPPAGKSADAAAAPKSYIASGPLSLLDGLEKTVLGFGLCAEGTPRIPPDITCSLLTEIGAAKLSYTAELTALRAEVRLLREHQLRITIGNGDGNEVEMDRTLNND